MDSLPHKSNDGTSDNGEYIVSDIVQILWTVCKKKPNLKDQVGCMDGHNTRKIKENMVADNGQNKKENSEEQTKAE